MAAKIIVVLGAGLMIALWSRIAWGSQAAAVYNRLGPDSQAWFWLRALRIPVNRSNCVTFLKAVSWFGIVVVVLLMALSWGEL